MTRMRKVEKGRVYFLPPNFPLTQELVGLRPTSRQDQSVRVLYMRRPWSWVSTGLGWVSADGLSTDRNSFCPWGLVLSSTGTAWVITCGLDDFTFPQLSCLPGAQMEPDGASKTWSLRILWVSLAAPPGNSRTVGGGGRSACSPAWSTCPQFPSPDLFSTLSSLTSPAFV